MRCSPRHKNCTKAHYNLVQSYRAARDAAVLMRESVTLGYDTETKEYGPIITFKDYLIGMAQ